MNETPTAIVLNEQLANKNLSGINQLYEFFKDQDKKLKEVLGWETGYYD